MKNKITQLNTEFKVSKESIYDLAAKIGVSASTVSRVLNRRPGIGEDTRQKVLELARTNGFRPRTRLRQTTIAIVIDRLQFSSMGGFVPSLLSYLMRSLSRKNYAVELVTEHNFNRLYDRLVDGVIALTWDDITVDALKTLQGVPVVTINRVDVPSFSAVATDHKRDGEMAANYLYERGHMKVALVTEERENWGSRERVSGFLAKCTELKMPIDPQSINYTGHQPAYGLLKRIIQELKPSALFVANENLALEVSYILKEMLGLRIPQDISILGMESPQVSQYLSPPMTSISQPFDQIAEKTIELMSRLVETDGMPPEVVMLKNQLIERESVLLIPKK
jgi:DNA-binding LacI/PurR family transcriptional regulator